MPTNPPRKTVLGLDPGTATVGFALVTGTKKNPQIQQYGVLRTLPQPAEMMPYRLLEIGRDLEDLIQMHQPDLAIVEDIFYFKNQTTIISVAQSRGVCLYLMAKYGMEIRKLTPLQIKQAITGYGRATKKQIQQIVQKIYGLQSLPKPDDAADALAIAWLGLP